MFRTAASECDCQPNDILPLGTMTVSHINSRCEHGESGFIAISEVTGKPDDVVTINEVIKTLIVTWFGPDDMRHVSEVTVEYDYRQGETHTLVIERSDKDLATLLWNSCPHGGYHSYATVFEWLIHTHCSVN